MYGTPSLSPSAVQVLTLDNLPGNVSFVAASNSRKPALEAYLIPPGWREGDSLEGQPRFVPSSRSWEGSTITFVFDEPLGYGSYRIYVHADRIRLDDGSNPVLTDENGNPWDGWVLTVQGDVRAVEPADTTEPDPMPWDPNVRPTDAVLPAPAQVYLDGKLLKPGQPDLSGEVLTIVADPSAQIELIVEPLLGEDTLYQRYLHHTDVIENGVLYQHWGSAGLIQNYKYAVYYGHQTQGKMLLDGGRFLIATPVLRIPSANDPLIGRNTQTLQAGLNSYQVTSLDVTPYKNIEIDGIPVQQYQPRPFVIPENIVDPNDTPQTNPFLFPGYLYLDSLQPLDGDEQMAVFDLPLNSRIYVVVNGQEVWWGQTRLLPMLVSPRRIQRSFSSMEELADLSYWIWRASMEALSLWKCALPSSVNVTMEEFVLSRVAYGWPREDGSQGSIRVQVGDTSFSGTSDHSLKRRLANLAEMLRACQDDPGLFPEDEFGAEWVSPHKYGDPYDARLPYLRDPAGAFSAASYTTLRQMLDPFEMRRPPRV